MIANRTQIADIIGDGLTIHHRAFFVFKTVSKIAEREKLGALRSTVT